MSIDTSGGHPDMDYKQHQSTYAGFVQATKIGVIFCVLLLIGMAVTLT